MPTLITGSDIAAIEATIGSVTEIASTNAKILAGAPNPAHARIGREVLAMIEAGAFSVNLNTDADRFPVERSAVKWLFCHHTNENRRRILADEAAELDRLDALY